MSIKKNITANYLGQICSIVMGLAFVPFFIRYLGMEAYGLIGLFAVMQTWLSLFDMGITPTLNREMARFIAGVHSSQSIQDLLRSLEILCFGCAIFICAVGWIFSGYLANAWLKAESLPNSVVAHALSIMAIVVALRLVESIYRGALLGLQRQVWCNGISTALSVFRNVGAVAILALVLPTIQAFFIWQAFMSFVSVWLLAAKVHQVLPTPPSSPKFSLEVIARIWKFAGGMTGITVLALLLTQVDKILLSRMLTLKFFGYYALATTIASLPYMVIGPITTAIYPSMVVFFTQDNRAALASIYHQGAQLVTILTAPAMMLLSFFPSGVIFLWSGDHDLVLNTSSILSVFVVGTFLNGLMWVPYQCQLATGWTSLVLKINALGVCFLIPAIFLAVPKYCAIGAAWAWVVLNIGYFLIAMQFMHYRNTPSEKWRWYFADVLLPFCGSLIVVILAKRFQPDNYQDRWHWLVFLLITGFLSLLAAAIHADKIRTHIIRNIDLFFCRLCLLWKEVD